MRFIITYPNGSVLSTSSDKQVVGSLKSYGVKGLKNNRTPTVLKEIGTHTFQGVGEKELKVRVY